MSFVVLSFAIPLPSEAHKLPIVRALLLEPTADHLEIAATITVPSGSPREAILATIDLDRDGKLDPTEETRLRSLLITRALDGVRLRIGTSTATLDHLESKLRVPPDKTAPIELMLHGTAPLPPRSEHPLELTVTNEPFGDPLMLRVLPGARPVLEASRGRVQKGGLAVDVALGDRVGWKCR